MDPGRPGDQEAAARQAEAGARATLQYGPRVRRLRRLWRTLPTSPRCKLCTSPFNGPAGSLLRIIGKGPWPANPRYCRWCFRELYKQRMGAEIECTLFFADVRGSTQLAETMHAREFRVRMERFYETAAKILVEHEAIVDKFVGDEVIGIFIPALSGEMHARSAIDAGIELLRATGHGSDSIWAPIGIGVNTGVAYVGAVGTAEQVEFSALGDPVNVTARLASAAAAGELLTTTSAARAAGLSDQGLEHRLLDLKGKTEATDVLVLNAGTPLG